MRLLLVDDDDLLASLLEKGLRTEGYALDRAATYGHAEALATRNEYDLILLDWNLPDHPGVRLCNALHVLGRTPLILMLTVRTTEDDRIAGLDAGADDYLAKPFGIGELKARIRALLRRAPRLAAADLQVGDVVVDRMHRVVRRAGATIDLTPKEYAILEYLALNAGRVVSREQLVNHVWDDNHDPASHALEVHINNIRSKLGAAQDLVQTRRGHGYLLPSPAESMSSDYQPAPPPARTAPSEQLPGCLSKS